MRYADKRLYNTADPALSTIITRPGRLRSKSPQTKSAGIALTLEEVADKTPPDMPQEMKAVLCKFLLQQLSKEKP
jgi:hypothetical protein